MSYIIHIDMNSYFASVEQQANPLFRNKPLGVCAYLSPKGCIIASSKEAKKVGIKTGCLVQDAKKLYPDVILVENEPAKYRSTTEKIFKVFSSYTERIEPYSIDEAFLDLSGLVRDYTHAQRVLEEIRGRIKKEVGEWLTCSAGISWTRFLAKFASDISESNDYLIIDSKEKMIATFDSVDMTEAWGIADRMEYRLNQLGIYTLNDLRTYPVSNLEQALGKMGYYLWCHVNGIEVEGVRTQEEQPPKSIGHTYCVPKQEPDMAYISAVMMKLCEKTGRRLRHHNLEAYGLYAGYTLKYGGGFFKHRRVYEPLYSTQDIYRQAERIILMAPPKDKIRMLGVSVTSLRSYSGQLNFFTDREKIYNIAKATDKINNRYGDYTVISGRMLGMEDQARDRIGFRKSVDIEGAEDVVKYV